MSASKKAPTPEGQFATTKQKPKYNSPTEPVKGCARDDDPSLEYLNGGLETVRIGDVEPEQVEWLWPGRFPLGKVSMVAGDPGLGKSLITLNISAHVTRGKPWPIDGSECPQGSVLIASAEDDVADTIRPRLDAAGANSDLVYSVRLVHACDPKTGAITSRGFSLKSDIDLLSAEIEKISDVRLVIIDPVSAFLDNTDSHKNADVRGLLTPLSELAQGHNVAILLVTHLNKGGSSNAMYRATGSLAFVAATRAAHTVSKDPGDPSRRLVLPAKSNLGPDIGGMSYSIDVAENGSPRVEWGSEPVTNITADQALSTEDDHYTSQRDEAMAWLKDALCQGPVATAKLKSLAQKDGHSWRTMERAKKKLGAKATKDGFREPWCWELPDKTGGNGADSRIADALTRACEGLPVSTTELYDFLSDQDKVDLASGELSDHTLRLTAKSIKREPHR